MRLADFDPFCLSFLPAGLLVVCYNNLIMIMIDRSQKHTC